MAKIKKGDLVVVISGAEKKQQGRVLSILSGDRIVVEGIRRVKRHTKQETNQRGSRTGGIETVESPIHVSNVMLVDPSTKQGTRVGYRTETIERDGRERSVRVRIAKRSGKDV